MSVDVRRRSALAIGAADGWTVMVRNLLKLRHKPGQVVAELAVPVVMVLLFGYVFGSAIAIGDDGNYIEYLMPGLLVMGAVLAALGTLTSIAKDNGLGVMDRFRSMPMARWAVPFGQTAATFVLGIGGLVLMSAVGLAFGWRITGGVLPALAAFGLILLLSYAVSWLGAALGSFVGDEETAVRVMTLALPVVTISNVFVPTDGMPAALRVIADWNPISAAVGAVRELFGNPGAPTAPAAWPLANPEIATVGWSLLLLLVCVPLAVRRFQKDVG
ncbi:MAG TPA: ABC transporter permease [Pseudonocardia sp.]|nr:ABC transporter permease [Pseudonocardia sp.]